VYQPKTAEEQTNSRSVQALYASAEAAAKDTPKFVSLFAEGGNFYDVSAGKKYYGEEIGDTVDIYATAFPDMHRELYSMYYLNPAHSTFGTPLNRPIDRPYKRFWYSEPYLTFGEVRLRCVGRREIYESPVITGV
jgi:hypothetical protein